MNVIFLFTDETCAYNYVISNHGRRHHHHSLVHRPDQNLHGRHLQV